MNRVLSVLLSVLLMGAFVACGTQTGDTGEQTSTPDTSSSTQPGADGTESTGGNENKNTDAPVFDLQKGTVTLNNGIEMPILGIGTFALSDSDAEESVYCISKTPGNAGGSKKL